MCEPLKQSDMDGKDRIGQDIETRTVGKQVKENKATVKGAVLRDNDAFAHARIPLGETVGDKPVTTADSRGRIIENEENFATTETPEFKKSAKNIQSTEEVE